MECIQNAYTYFMDIIGVPDMLTGIGPATLPGGHCPGLLCHTIPDDVMYRSLLWSGRRRLLTVLSTSSLFTSLEYMYLMW